MSENQPDPGAMYAEPWVQQGIQQIKDMLVEHHEFVGIDCSTKRVLDYACGDGTVTKVCFIEGDRIHDTLTRWQALLKVCPDCTFRGIDSHHAQVERYNNEARRLLGDSGQRMLAVEGDLTTPDSSLNTNDWSGFDVAAISMALHHVQNPIELLKSLLGRVRKGGVMIIVEFTDATAASPVVGQVHSEDHMAVDGCEKKNTGHRHHHHQHDPEQMIEVAGGQKIWPGFAAESLEAAMIAAGCVDVDVKLHGETFIIPADIGHGGEKRLMLARGTVT